MAASTITNFKRYPLGNGGDWLITFTYTGPSSYSSGGDAWTPAQMKAKMEGIGSITALASQAMFVATDASKATWCSFQPINDGTNCGKFHIYNAVDVHTHDMLAKGGLTSSEALFLDASQSFGKNAATDRTIVGSTSATTGGVKNNAAVTAAADTTSADYSTYSCQFFGVGRF